MLRRFSHGLQSCSKDDSDFGPAAIEDRFRVQGVRVWGLGFRVQGLEFRVYGLGFRV